MSTIDDVDALYRYESLISDIKHMLKHNRALLTSAKNDGDSCYINEYQGKVEILEELLDLTGESFSDKVIIR